MGQLLSGSREFGLALGLYLLSGLSGLIYEVLWTRRFSLVFGHSVLAASVVASTFLLGLGLGALLCGSFLDRRQPAPASCLRLYAWLEGGIGLWAVASLGLLPLLERLYLAGGGGLALRLLAAGLVLLPPTLAMGATLPLMARACQRAQPSVSRRIGWLYGVNTVGAGSGAFVAGYLLLPAYGYTLTLLGTALVSLSLATQAAAGATLFVAMESEPEPEAPGEGVPGGVLLAVAFLTGVGSLVWQIGWTRALVLSLGSSVYAFSAVLTTFLWGLGLGSLAYARRPSLTLPAALLAAAGLGMVVIVGLGTLPATVVQLFPWVRGSGFRMLLLQLSLAGALLFPACLAMGVVFPACVRLYPRRLGARISWLYIFNTLGCCLGALAAGFWLLPALGVQRSLELGVLAYLLACLALLLTVRNRGPWLAALSLEVVALLGLPTWSPALLTSGPAVYAGSYAGASSETLDTQLLTPPSFHKDGLSTTVSVHMSASNHLSLRVNGKVDASLAVPDMITTRLLAAIPALLHGQPRRAALIGLGAGFTVQTLTDVRGLLELDVFELEPAVLETQVYWAGYNGRAISRRGVNVRLTDGRSALQESGARYDLILSEPSNPWMAGVGDLFSREFYRTCRARLAPGGLMGQWFHLYGVSRREVASVVRTFFATFPHGSIWLLNQGDILLVGAERPVLADRGAPGRLLTPPLERQLAELSLHGPEAVWGHFLADRETALARLPAAAQVTDDNPLLEFRAPLHLYRNLVPDNLSMLGELWSAPGLPPGLNPTPARLAQAGWAWLALRDEARLQWLLARQGGLALLEAERLAPQDPEAALRCYHRALEQGEHLAAWRLGERYFRNSEWKTAASLYEMALQKPPWGCESALLRRLGEARLHQGLLAESESALRWSQALEPASDTMVALADVQLRAGNLEEALGWLGRAGSANPAHVPTLMARALVLVTLERYGEAEAAYRQLVELVPDHAEGWLNLSYCLAQLGRPAEAEQACLQVLRYEPRNRSARAHLEALRQ